MRKVIFISMIVNLSWATDNTIDLDILLNNNNQKDKLDRFIEDSYLSNTIKGVANSQTAPLSFDSTLSRSISKPLSGFEYEIGFSKELKVRNVQELEQKSTILSSEATKIEQQKRFVILNNTIKNLYNQYCLDREYQNYFRINYNEFDALHQKKKIAYELGEISKRELVQIKLKKDELSIDFDNFSTRVNDEKVMLLSFGNFDIENQLNCYDMTPIDGNIEANQEKFSLSKKAYEKIVESNQVSIKRYYKKFDKIELSTHYTKEIDRDVYSIGVSIPLNISSKKYEYKRASLMNQISAIQSNQELFIQKSLLKIKELKLKLKRIYKDIVQKKSNIENYEASLLPLEQKSYNYGESSVVEYLLAKQNIMRYKEKLLEKKRDYYQLLFSLYTIMEKR